MKLDPVRAVAPSTVRVPSPGKTPPSGASKSGAAGAATWSTFWREFGPENAPLERCHVPADGRWAVDQHWGLFADPLPRGARVIDLGCGAGVAGRRLLDRRSDLDVVGIDWADVPIAPRRNLTIHPGVAMEALPFADRSFDAAISLFGIEYGDMAKIARQLERVLKPGAYFSFLVHHQDSEIPREGGVRRRALRELIAGRMKQAFLAGNGEEIGRQRLRLKAQCPGEPMVGLVSDYFRRNIELPRSDRQRIWQKLADGLVPEIALLAHLERSAKSAAAMGAWLVPLLPIMRLVGVSVLRRGSGQPIAWNVSGIR